MRPINLKIKGINSYVAEQEINFDKLAESKLFGIFGETGSGKTTILDAIIIALYGSSDREIIPNIINVNSQTAHIYFTFQVDNGNSEEVYVVKRDYTVRKSGVKSEAILMDINNKVLAEQPEQVNEVILGLIGVGKKEFQKCIALPQGEFDRFLTDTPANRKKTIAKLFNLEMFGAELQEKIKHHKDLINLNKLNIQDRISSFSDVTEENLEEMRQNLNDNQKSLNETKDIIKEKKENLDILKKDYEINTKLLEINAQLGLLKAEENEIKLLKQQVEYTTQYGNFVNLKNKQVVLETEIDSITDELLMDKKLLLNNDDKLKDTESKILVTTEKLKSNKARLNLLSSDLEKYQRLNIEKLSLEESKEKLEVEIDSLSQIVRELKDSLLNYKNLSNEQQSSVSKITKAIDSNNEILAKLKEVSSVKTVESFVDYLNYLKNIINPDSLQEVYQFNIHGEVNELLDSISNYEMSSRKSVVNLEKEYQSLLVYNDDLGSLEVNLEKSNVEYSKALDKVKENLLEIKNKIAICTTKIDEKSQQVSDLKQKLRELNTKIKINESELNSLKDVSVYSNLTKTCDDMSNELEGLNKFKQELQSERNELIVSIEVGTVQLENLKSNLSEINKEMKKNNIDYDNNMVEIDNKLYLNNNQLSDAKTKFFEVETKINELNNKKADLAKDLTNEGVDFNRLREETECIHMLEEKEKTFAINIALCNQFINQLKENLTKLNQLKNQKEEILKQLDVVTELSNLTSNGKLLDYVSEEYMVLITQFSNRFVYKISKGKYMLKYNGEFNVIDNFNGGVSRSVKTLSGGERFIISLSLALGISQSIAINNNRSFNFFFIDEGFGSLSDEYIETVLRSFDSLVKLNFTVGFISHVEKMQNYINNRIVVTKKNNDEGSIVKQFY